jgi:glycosyltransferase involved in cell wall biosynthesis
MVLKRKLKTTIDVMFQRFHDWLFSDFVPARLLIGGATAIIGVIFLVIGRRQAGLDAVARVHRSDYFPALNSVLTSLMAQALAGSQGRVASQLRLAVHEYPDSIAPNDRNRKFFTNPKKLFPANSIVLKSPGPNERGVIYLYYSYVYPLFMRLLDTKVVASHYHLVLEPSWSGYFDPNILTTTQLNTPIFVGSIEPRDTAFLKAVHPNLIPVSISGNTWVNADVFHPLHSIEKDFDLISIAAWARYKRHWALFRAVARMRAMGHAPRLALVGYPLELTKKDILSQARLFKIDDLIEIFEQLTPREVNELLNRSKVHVLWSRREGVNRAIIEAMASGVPNVVRHGFNYGYHYPYIKDRTGKFATEQELPKVLINMIENYKLYSPRDYVLSFMTPEASTQRLNQEICRVALSLGEVWTRDLAIKVSTLGGLMYLDPSDNQRFADDYRFLETVIRS